MSVDINEIKRSLDSSSGLNRTLLIGFYSLMVYLAITIASVADADLFFPNHTLSLPILKIDLNITYFFTFTPLVVLVTHVNVLVNLSHHRNKLEAYIQEDPKASPLYYHPFLYNFIRKSADVSDHSRKYNFATTNFLRIFIWTSLVILPLVVLIFLQVKFLPVQHPLVNIGLVGVVFLDAIFLWRFRKAISTQAYTMPPGEEESTDAAADGEITGNPAGGRSILPRKVISGALVYLKLLMVVATPLLSISLYLSATGTPGRSSAYHFELQDMVLAESKSDIKSILGSESKLETAWAELAMADKVEGKNIRYGLFDRSIFTRISFRGSNLGESSFRYARFEYVNFQDAIAKNAHFNGATIRVGLFYRTNMPNADFEDAELGTVDFDSSDLRRANFTGATMYGASFKDANLSGARFYQTKLAGANFENADLTGAEFSFCDLNGANFSNATLKGAIFTKDELAGADFDRARMQGALIGNCNTSGSSFMYTELDGGILFAIQPNCMAWKVSNPDRIFLNLNPDTAKVEIDPEFYTSVLADRVQVSPQTDVLTPRASFFSRIDRIQDDCPEPYLQDHQERFDPAGFRKAFQNVNCGSEYTNCERLLSNMQPINRRQLGGTLCNCPEKK